MKPFDMQMELYYQELKEALEAGSFERCEAVLKERQAFLEKRVWQKEDAALLDQFEKRDRALIRKLQEEFSFIKSVSKESYEALERRRQYKMYE